MDNKKQIAEHVAEIMKLLGLDITDPNFKDTPMRVSKMYHDELFAGLTQPQPEITLFPNDYGQNIVLEKDITFTSTCGHHWMPIVGICHFAYIPGKWVAGLSKFHRGVKHFAATPQIQEKLVDEIGKFFVDKLQTPDVAVIMKAEHHCIKCRGVRDQTSATVTSFVSGLFKTNPSVKAELYSMLQL